VPCRSEYPLAAVRRTDVCVATGLGRMLGMSEQVLRMTTGHLVRWTIIYGFFVGLSIWYALTATSAVGRIIAVVLGLLALRGLVGSLLAFVRRPSLRLGPDVLALTVAVGARGVRWAECSEFWAVQTWSGGHVRYRDGVRRRSLPAGFGDAGRRLGANELADVLNRARGAASTERGPASL